MARGPFITGPGTTDTTGIGGRDMAVITVAQTAIVMAAFATIMTGEDPTEGAIAGKVSNPTKKGPRRECSGGRVALIIAIA